MLCSRGGVSFVFLRDMQVSVSLLRNFCQRKTGGLQKARRRALTCAASLSINNMLCPRGAEFYFTSSLLTFAPRRTM